MPWKRRPFSGGDLGRALNIADLRAAAQRRVPHFVFEYVEGGAEDEASLRANRSSFETLRLVPQTLVDTSNRTLRTEILGRPAAAPLVIGPTGLNGMLHADGDIGLAGEHRGDFRARVERNDNGVDADLETGLFKHPLGDAVVRVGIGRGNDFQALELLGVGDGLQCV